MQPHRDTLPLTPCSLPVPQDPIPPPPVALHYQEEAGNPRAGLTQQPNPSVLGRAVSPLCPPPQQWLCHSHHPVEAPGQQLPAAPQGLPHAQGLVSGTHGALQGKGHCQGLCQPQGTTSTVPGAALAPWHTHPPWLRCSRPPRPPWAPTWGTPAPLQRQAGSGGLSQAVAVGSSHPPDKPCGYSGFQPQRWRLSAALQGILEAWMKAGIPCKAQCGTWPWSTSTGQGETDPESP